MKYYLSCKSSIGLGICELYSTFSISKKIIKNPWPRVFNILQYLQVSCSNFGKQFFIASNISKQHLQEVFRINFYNTSNICKHFYGNSFWNQFLETFFWNQFLESVFGMIGTRFWNQFLESVLESVFRINFWKRFWELVRNSLESVLECKWF